MSRRRARPSGVRVPPRLPAWLPFAALTLLLALFSFRYHEFWRDEAGAMLEASAVPWAELPAALRLEGIPPLYHALLKLLGALFPHRQALVVAGALGFATLLLGTHRLIEAVAGSRRAAAGLTLALACTYAYAYELGVMMRQYTLGLGLALLCLAHLRRALAGRRRHLWAATLAGALAVLTSAHSACLAGGGLLAFALISLARGRKAVSAWPILLTLPCFALVVFNALPCPGRTPEGNQVFHPSAMLAARLSVQALVAGLMPFDWWHAESFVPRLLARPFAVLRSVAFSGFLVAALLTLALRVRAAARDRLRGEDLFDLLALLLSWPPLLVIMVGHYWGFYRHHLFLGLPAVILLAAWASSGSAPGQRVSLAARAPLFALAPWLLLQVALAFGDIALDHRYPFSDTKAAAAALPPDAHVVAADEWRSGGMLFWRPDLHLRTSSGGGRDYRYTRPDIHWHRRVPLLPLVEEECSAAPARVYLAGPADILGLRAACASPIAYPRTAFADHPFTWETFELHHIDCPCLGGALPPRE